MPSFLDALSIYGVVALAIFVASAIYHRLVISVGTLTKKKFENGLDLHYIGGDAGTTLVYREIFEHRTYFKNGVSLEGIKKPFVLDIGTNIGFFALSVALENPDAQIECFEPVPRLCEAIRANLKKYIAAGNVMLHNVGLGAKDLSFEMEADLSFSAGSSFHGDSIKSALRGVSPIAFIRAAMLDSVPMGILPQQPTTVMAELLGIPVLGYFFLVMYIPLFVLGLAWIIGVPKDKKITKFTAQIRPLASILKERKLDGKPIDMVKVDVEGAEMEVLDGFTDDIWSNVQQIVIETHDINNRITTIMAMLKKAGFDNVVEEEEPLVMHQLLKMSTIFASRTKKQ